MLTSQDNFKIKKTIGSSWITDQEDVEKTKSALENTGDYKTPDWGIDGISDDEMFDGLKSFQKREGLQVDGVMKPGGPTEERLRQATQKARSTTSVASLPQSRKPIQKTAQGIAEGEWDWQRPRVPGRQERSESVFDDLPSGPVTGQSSKWQIGHIPELDDQRLGDRSQKSERDRSQDVQVAMAPVITYGAELLKRYGPQASRAFENIVRSVPPLLGAAEQIEKRSGQSENENGRYLSPIPQPSKDDILKAKQANMDRADPLSPMPGIEPPNEKLQDRTESPNEVIELPDLSGSIPETNEPTIFVYPAAEPNEFGDGIVENKGNEATRKELECVRDYFELQNGWKHINGGRYGPRHEDVLSGKREDGEELKEYHVPGHFGSLKGGRFSDLTFEIGKNRLVHVQTVDVDKNGQTTQKEWDAAEAIRRATGHSVLLIAKGAQLDRLIKRCKEL